MTTRTLSLTSCAGLAFLLGCGRSDPWIAGRPPRVPASGTVSFNGEPTAGATVIFHPKGDGYPAAGLTDSQGQFTLRTFEPNDGAVPGEYRVTVVKVENVPHPSLAGDILARHHLPGSYAKPDTTDLTASVAEGQSNRFTFDLQGTVPTVPEPNGNRKPGNDRPSGE